ncbi:MAG TPA: GNAT family N-acetyltransferase, partial [Blastocatellia bacterium]|nr:GNAT family N-acetyltransferase [Blastocatellia bacterium]
RLLIREWQVQDWLAFRPIATHPEVMRYIAAGVPWADDQIQSFVARQIENARRDGYCLWKLVDKADHRLIGFCGLQKIRTIGEVEIGWWLARDFWGKGLATEAANAALECGFKTFKLKRIIAIAQPENSASTNVMRKIGMTFEKETSTEELGKSPEGIKLVLYSIASSEALT